MGAKMAFEIGTIKTDAELEVNGAWTTDLGHGLKLFLGRIGNRSYQRLVREYAASQRSALGPVEINEDEATAELLRIYAETILLGWEGLEEGGETLEYSKDTAIRLLEEYPDFFRLVRAEASKIEWFRAKQIEEDAGNSQGV